MTTEARILQALRAADTGAVSGAELAQQLGLSRTAIWKHIVELRAMGYDIAASPLLGYRLVSVPDVVHADDLSSRLGPRQVIGRDIRVFRLTTSTNDVVERLARDGVKEGVVVFAESQTAGRGRLGRKWVSPAGKGLWLSVLLRPDLRPQETTQLTIAVATALARAIRAQTGLAPSVKWPNDLLVNGKKVAGILTELSAELDQVKYAILGIGVNANLTASDFPAELRRSATSLRIESGGLCDRPALAVAILRELEEAYAKIRRGQFEAVSSEWESLCSTLGQEVVIRFGERQLKGRAESLDADGALLLRTQHGRLERITGGDVTVVKTRPE